MTVRVCTEHWPLLILVAEGALERESLHALERDVNALYAKRERFATLVETSAVETMPTPPRASASRTGRTRRAARSLATTS